jgi:uncharacterized protein (TIGR00299 family) protein
MVKYPGRRAVLKIAYFDCFSGISGDMCLGALIDAGVSLSELEKELNKIPAGSYRLFVKKVKRSHLAACKADVTEPKNKIQNSRSQKWRDIEKIIHNSPLSGEIKRKGLNIFKRIFKAEAKAHGETFNRVHLHELGATDCIIDVFGTIIGLNMLGVEKIYSSTINLGNGLIKTDGGILPVPAPATAEILKDVPVYSNVISSELTTPTGAAIIKELSCGYGDIPCMDIGRIGVGAGHKNFKNWPNVLRIFIGNAFSPHYNKGRTRFSNDTVTVIETNIDDMNPQLFEYAIERLYKAGAIEIFLTQIIMKKGRPAVKLTVLCKEDRKEKLMNIILRETSTLGLRFYEMERKVLPREIKKVTTKFGKVRIKYAGDRDKILKAAPEYEDCKKIAKKINVPLIDVMKRIKYPAG